MYVPVDCMYLTMLFIQILILYASQFVNAFLSLILSRQQVTQIEHDLKTKSSAYNTIRGTLASLERKAT